MKKVDRKYQMFLQEKRCLKKKKTKCQGQLPVWLSHPWL